jgi:hypothetical protein
MMMKTTDEQRRIARECSTFADGVTKLRRTGLSGGRAIKLLAEQNAPLYNMWREQPPQQGKPTDIAKNPQRFSFRG